MIRVTAQEGISAWQVPLHAEVLYQLLNRNTLLQSADCYREQMKKNACFDKRQRKPGRKQGRTELPAVRVIGAETFIM